MSAAHCARSACATVFMLAVAVRAIAQAGAGASASHVIFIDANGHDANPGSATAPVASLDRALALAHALAPSEAMPVLIRLGQGAFPAPSAKSLVAGDFSPARWRVTQQHIYFAGNGPDNTRILAARIIIDPAAITGFKDLMLDATVELGDSFLPVHNVQVRDVEMRGGQLDGLWRDTAGAVHLSRLSAEEVATALPSLAAHSSAVAQFFSNIFLITNRLVHPATPPLTYSPAEPLAAPDPDATNTFVLKAGDTMTGPLRIERYYPADKITMSPYPGSTNIAAQMRLESSDGANWGWWFFFTSPSNDASKTPGGIVFRVGNTHHSLLIAQDYLSTDYKPIKHIWPVQDTYDAANKWYVDTQVGTRISSVTAGDGLTGGGGPGAVTLDVNPGDGIAIAADTVAADGTLLRTGAAAQTYLSLADGVTRGMLAGATNALDLRVSTNYLPALSNWTIGYVDALLTNGQSVVVFISTNNLQIVSNTFYFYGDLILLSNQIWGLGWPVSNDNAATKGYVDTQDAATLALATNLLTTWSQANFVNKAGDTMSGYLTLNAAPQAPMHATPRAYVDAQAATLSNALAQVQRGFAFVGQTNLLVCESAQETPPAASARAARYQSVRSERAGLLHAIEVWTGSEDPPPQLVVHEGENIAGEELAVAYADGKPDNGWQRYGCEPHVPIAVGQHYCFGTDKGSLPAVDVRLGRDYPRGRAWLPPAFPARGGWDDNYDLAFRVWLQETRETHSVRIDEHGIAVSNALFSFNGEQVAVLSDVARATNAILHWSTTNFVNKAGDIMLGDLYFTNNRRIVSQCLSTMYGQNSFATVAGVVGGYYSVATNLVEAYAINGYSGTAIVKLYPHATGINSSNAYIDASGVQLRNVGTPTAASDAATRGYIDTKQFGAGNLADNAVTAAKLAPNAVTTDKLANGAVTAAKLAQMGASGGQVLKWTGSAWAPAADNAGMSQTDADPRYVNATGDEMSGTLTATALYSTGPDDWRVGSLLQPDVDVMLLGANSKITTPAGKNVVLAPGGAALEVTTNLTVQGSVTAAGEVAAAGGLRVPQPWCGQVALPTTSGSDPYRSIFVPLAQMRSTHIVLLTMVGITKSAKQDHALSVVAQTGGFTIYYHKNCGGYTGNYLVIRQ